MNIERPPTSWSEVSEEHFKELLSNVDWRRDTYVDGEWYYIGNNRIGVCIIKHFNRRYWVDPTFFKPA